MHNNNNNNVVVFPFYFFIVHAVGQHVVYSPLRIVSHLKDKKFVRPLPAHLPSDKVIGTLVEAEPLSHDSFGPLLR